MGTRKRYAVSEKVSSRDSRMSASRSPKRARGPGFSRRYASAIDWR
jgi:hypothetical protein